MKNRLEIQTDHRGDGLRVVLSGVLTAHTLHTLEGTLKKLPSQSGGTLAVDLKGLSLLDTDGALLLNLAVKSLSGRGMRVSLENTDEQQQKILKQSVLPEPEEKKEKKASRSWFIVSLNSLGHKVCEVLYLLGQLVGFLGQFLVTMGKILRRPGDMRWTSLIYHMEQTGLRAVPIVALLTFLIGLVVAYMGAQQLSMFGADIFAVNLLEVTVLREMAVLITSIVVAGRSSSSYTAQIGAMVANDEVDAMRSMGLDPSTILVVPRVLALILTLPMLVFLADIMALLGGAVAIWFTIGMNFSSFVGQLHDVAKIGNFLVGMVKTPFFALFIGLVGCFQGFRATSNAESVGFLTTIAVVQSIFVVILLDALFAIFFTTIGI